MQECNKDKLDPPDPCGWKSNVKVSDEVIESRKFIKALGRISEDKKVRRQRGRPRKRISSMKGAVLDRSEWLCFFFSVYIVVCLLIYTLITLIIH